jgi:hypothetical protein
MRKSSVIAAVTLAFLVLVPAPLSHAAPSHDQVVGTASIAQFGSPTLHVNANLNRSGVKGTIRISYPDGTDLKGKVTCLSVNGNIGYVIGRITDSVGQPPHNWLPGNFVVAGVKDNGEPGTDGPDLLNFSPGFATEPACAPNPAAHPTLPVVQGNYKVNDAP